MDIQSTEVSIHTSVKACAACAHLIGVRLHIENADKWICGAEQNRREEPDLVTGKVMYHNDIRTARYSFCKGDWFILYVLPDYGEYAQTSAASAKKPLSKTTLDDL